MVRFWKPVDLFSSNIQLLPTFSFFLVVVHTPSVPINHTTELPPGEDSISFTLETPEVECDAMANYTVVDTGTNENLAITWAFSESRKNLTIYISNLKGEPYHVVALQTVMTANNSCFWQSLPSHPFLLFRVSIEGEKFGIDRHNLFCIFSCT